MAIDYSPVTEVPGDGASYEQLQRLFSRYHFAAQYCRGRDVLEVACGAGQGLGYLARNSNLVVGGDLTLSLVSRAQSHYKGRVPLLRLDAHHLPFQNHTFDVIILYEAIYYLTRPDAFLAECKRVLKAGGILLLCTVNKDWSDFNPSPHGVRYFSAPELEKLLSGHFVGIHLYGGFLATSESARDNAVSLLQRVAAALHLIPRTMKGKALLKRVFFGKLKPVPDELATGMCEYVPPSPIPHNEVNCRHKVIYAVARK